MFNRLLFVFLPVSLLVLPCIFHLAFEDSGFYFAKESGAVENITAILLAVAIGVVLRLLIRLLTLGKLSGTLVYKNLTILWSFIYFLGCVYFLGEEISWGQHLFGWETPDAWQEINDQDETNLHNISGWLDQVPRTILSIGIVGGGFIFPLLRRSDSQNHSNVNFLKHFMPGWSCVYAGGCFVAIVLMLSLVKITGISLPKHTGGEVKESLIAMFLLVYIADFSTRAIRNRVENRVDC